jgi:hypothetical protein
MTVGIKISSRTTLNLLPGTYTSDSPAAKLLPTSESFLAGFASWSAGVEPYEGSSFYFPLTSGSKSGNTSSEEGRKDGEGDGGWPLIVTGPAGPTTFTSSGYASTPHLLSSNTTSTTANTNTNVDWESLYLPPGVYLSFPPPSSSNGAGVDERYRNVVFRGSVPMRQGLVRDIRSLDLSLGGGRGRFGSGKFPCVVAQQDSKTSEGHGDLIIVFVLRRRLFPGLWAWRVLPPFNDPQSDILLVELDYFNHPVPILAIVHLHLPPRIHRPNLRGVSSRALRAGVSALSSPVL